MRQTLRIPCVMMRGGTSRGPYFHASDLPSDTVRRDAILTSVMGSGQELEIDGIGGGAAVTSKVAIVSPSARADADVDYLFAQVLVGEPRVDTSPNCGNMLAGIGPFAIESGLVAAADDVTRVRVFNVNTSKIIELAVRTPGRHVTYIGDAAISGVPGTAAPIHMSFLNSAGSKTGALMPTGRPLDRIAGVDVSCIDAAMPVVLVRARDLGKTGSESPTELEADKDFMQRLEEIRVAAGIAMGIPDAAERVIPKPVLVASGTEGTTLTVRYFMPHNCHPSLAITGSVALASACCTPGTLAAEICGQVVLPSSLIFTHPSGNLEAVVEAPGAGETIPKVSVVRTARRLFEGFVFAEISVDS